MENLSEKEVAIIRLVQLITNMKEAVAWHKGQSPMDNRSIQNYSELKSRFEKELLNLLATELDISIPIAA